MGMQFLLSVISDSTELANSDEMNAIDRFNDSLRAHGHWVYANGITSPSEACIIDNRRNVGTVTQGPLHNGNEHIAGFWIIAAPDLDTAKKIALEGSHSCNRKIELRQLHGD